MSDSEKNGLSSRLFELRNFISQNKVSSKISLQTVMAWLSIPATIISISLGARTIFNYPPSADTSIVMVSLSLSILLYIIFGWFLYLEKSSIQTELNEVQIEHRKEIESIHTLNRQTEDKLVKAEERIEYILGDIEHSQMSAGWIITELASITHKTKGIIYQLKNKRIDLRSEEHNKLFIHENITPLLNKIRDYISYIIDEECAVCIKLIAYEDTVSEKDKDIADNANVSLLARDDISTDKRKKLKIKNHYPASDNSLVEQIIDEEKEILRVNDLKGLEHYINKHNKSWHKLYNATCICSLNIDNNPPIGVLCVDTDKGEFGEDFDNYIELIRELCYLTIAEYVS